MQQCNLESFGKPFNQRPNISEFNVWSYFSPQEIKSCYTTGIMWYMGIPGFKQHISHFDRASPLIISFDYVPSHLNRLSPLYNRDQASKGQVQQSLIYQFFILSHVLVWRCDHSSETNPQYHIYCDTKKKKLAKNWKKKCSRLLFIDWTLSDVQRRVVGVY